VLLLAASVGLPFFVLSTTGPLVQWWYAGRRAAQFPYRLFALSNAASLAALVAYPVVVEPAFPLKAQLRWWTGGYLAVAAFVVLGAIANRRWGGGGESDGADGADAASRPLLWIALAACASTLWLATSNYLSQNVAAIPFLWVLPMGTYLLSFILCFEWEGCYRPAWFRWLLRWPGWRWARGSASRVRPPTRGWTCPFSWRGCSCAACSATANWPAPSPRHGRVWRSST